MGDLLLTSFAAWIGSLPLVAYYFHISLPSAPRPMCSPFPLRVWSCISNLASLLLAGWFPAAAELFNHAGWFLMECIRVSSHWFAHWPGAYFTSPRRLLFTTSLYYAILLALSDRLALPAPTAHLEVRRARARRLCAGAGNCWQSARSPA